LYCNFHACEIVVEQHNITLLKAKPAQMSIRFLFYFHSVVGSSKTHLWTVCSVFRHLQHDEDQSLATFTCIHTLPKSR